MTRIGKQHNLLYKSKKHLAKSKETYGNHCVFAFFAGMRLIFSGVASIIHGLVPAFFEGTAAITVIELYHKRLINHPNPDYEKYISDIKRDCK